MLLFTDGEAIVAYGLEINQPSDEMEDFSAGDTEVVETQVSFIKQVYRTYCKV